MMDIWNGNCSGLSDRTTVTEDGNCSGLSD